MALDFNSLLRLAKGAPRAIKIIAAVAAVDLVILLASTLALEDQVASSADEVQRLRNELKSVRDNIEGTRRDIDRLPELRKEYDQAVSDGLLGVQDRLKLVQVSQEFGTQHKLVDMRYRLDPEKIAAIPNSKFQLVSSRANFVSGALLDTDILGFWEDVLQWVPGHFEIESATVERTQEVDDTRLNEVRAGRPTAFVHTTLDFNWIVMRAPTAVNQ